MNINFLAVSDSTILLLTLGGLILWLIISKIVNMKKGGK
jgi:hypothetical protein